MRPARSLRNLARGGWQDDEAVNGQQPVVRHVLRSQPDCDQLSGCDQPWRASSLPGTGQVAPRSCGRAQVARSDAKAATKAAAKIGQVGEADRIGDRGNRRVGRERGDLTFGKKQALFQHVTGKARSLLAEPGLQRPWSDPGTGRSRSKIERGIAEIRANVCADRREQCVTNRRPGRLAGSRCRTDSKRKEIDEHGADMRGTRR